MNFMDLQFKNRGSGVQARVNFPNGYGASVVRGEYTYGGSDGLYELAVMQDGDLCYTSGITDDVLGYLTEEQVSELLQRIEALGTTPAQVEQAATMQPQWKHAAAIVRALGNSSTRAIARAAFGALFNDEPGFIYEVFAEECNPMRPL